MGTGWQNYSDYNLFSCNGLALKKDNPLENGPVPKQTVFSELKVSAIVFEFRHCNLKTHA
jgi:hypothetical protein